jgi:hypothetical protein
MEDRRNIERSKRSGQPTQVELGVFEDRPDLKTGWGTSGGAVQVHSALSMIRESAEPEKLQEIKPDPSGENRVEHINAALTVLNRGVHPGQQQQLFKHTPPQPATYTVHYLAGSRIGRIHSMNLLGIAKNIADEQGIDIRPDSNLSGHSMSLVKNLADRGVVRPSDVPKTTENTLDFAENRIIGKDSIYEVYNESIPKEEIAAGRQTVRNILKSTRTPKTPPLNPDQLQLDL